MLMSGGFGGGVALMLELVWALGVSEGWDTAGAEPGCEARFVLLANAVHLYFDS
jgi:hypothetical protein